MSASQKMKTPLKNVRGLGSAKDGTDHFWRQRMTAIANIPLMLFFIWLVIKLSGVPFEEARATFANPLVAAVMATVVICGFIHMKLGMQVIIEDYIHGEGLKVALLMLNTFFCFFLGLAALFAVLKMSFGA